MPLIESLQEPVSPRDPVAEPERAPAPLRWFAAVAAGSVALGYALAAALLALAVSTASGAGSAIASVPAVAVPGWLVAHQVPLSIQGAPLSALPFLPTLVLGAGIAWLSAAFARRTDDPRDAVRLVVVVAMTHAVVGGLAASLLGGVVAAAVPGAVLRCGLVAAVSAGLGVLRRERFRELLGERLGARLWPGVRAAGAAWLPLAVAGALVVVPALCLSAPRIGDVLVSSGSIGDGFGLVLLSLLYLPNALLAGWAFAAGPGIAVGPVQAGPFTTVPGRVPEVPLLAALPDGAAAGWWPIALLLPVAVGAFVGFTCGREPGSRRERLRSAAVAVLVSALGVFLIGILAGGSAGGGSYESITVHPVVLGLATFGWLLPPAALVALLFPAGLDDEVRVAAPRSATEVAADDEPETTEDAGPDDDPDAAADSAPDEDPDAPAEAESGGDAADSEGEPAEAIREDELDEAVRGDELEEVDPRDELDPDEVEWADLIRRVQQADTTGDPRN
ncbi:hypothetical protein INP57_03520 [Saccharopolyspora sp. HNM0986]|uniref:cell division protein PerM n=1 Tax=Saccharopolyspora galaxeae TaxID=2781241 RepID=UPI00190E272D|nr:DUF6350 family protein [Saccharopolyspora sp. HNM0986]MBK0865869.1 hypothetical protein [Saccharopolyspora sp. HNM0986]